VRKEIRELVVFAPQNLILEPSFTKLDILSCRNLLVYLTPKFKKQIPLFHYSLNPGGILFQGSAETIGDYTNLFAPLIGESRIFWRKESLLRPKQIVFPSFFSGSNAF
jgi:chemotaxis methyl-accepting protein methylase